MFSYHALQHAYNSLGGDSCEVAVIHLHMDQVNLLGEYYPFTKI